jgi:hypothetical protein
MTRFTLAGSHHFDLVKTLRSPPDANSPCGFFLSRFVIFPNTIELRIAGQGFLRGTRIALKKRRRALHGHETRKSMRKAMKILLAVDG